MGDINEFMKTALINVLIGLAAMTGCARNCAYRTSYQPSETDPTTVIEASPDYKLGFVEFDDQGGLWKARQRIEVEQMIRTEAGIDTARPTNPQGIILVAFVHGWKSNASYDSDGVVAF